MGTSKWIGWLGLLLTLGGMVVVLLGGWSPGRADSSAGTAIPAEAVDARTKTVLSEVYNVDRKYRSMMGPFGQQQVHLGEDGAEPELVWITGYEAVMVAADGTRPMPQDFMCHSNLDVDLDVHEELFGVASGFGARLFTLSQGQFSVHFPDGFGIPVLSDEPLSLTTQVLNLNAEGQAFDVRHKVTIEYLRDRDSGGGMTALFPTAAYGLTLLEGEDGYYGVGEADREQHGPGCLVGETASDHSYDDGMGRTFTGHWLVKPGREVNRTLVTRLMRIPYDTTLHYIAVHLHPFAESLELRDLTAGKTLFVSSARNFKDKIGLAHVDYFASPEGIPVHKDHEYEIVSTYHNTTDEDQDSMAVMYLYLRDLEFEKRWAKLEKKTLRARRDSPS